MKLQLRQWLLVAALLVPLARGQHERYVCACVWMFTISFPQPPNIVPCVLASWSYWVFIVFFAL